jgi:hypothetical protein
MIEPKSRGVPDTPQEPVVGLAEGETRWRGTIVFVAIHAITPHAVMYGFRARADAQPGEISTGDKLLFPIF